MPRVPTYENFQTTPTTLPNARIDDVISADKLSVGARQMRQMGNAVQRVGDVGGGIALDMQSEANQLRVDDAINRRRELEARLSFDPEAGYTFAKGINALERKSGKPLADEYAEEYRKGIGSIAETLGNDAQRQAFLADSDNAVTGFYGRIVQHEGQEFQTYALSVREGTINTEINNIGLRYREPDEVTQSVASIRAAAYDIARKTGKSATEAENYAKEMTSKAHLTAIKAALQDNNATFADEYRKRFAGDMTADALLSASGAITPQLTKKVALDTVNEIMTDATRKIVPSDSDRAFNVAIQTESGGRQFAEDGTPLTSKAGAIGVAQVMPDTAPEAAKLAGVEWDEELYKTDAIYNYTLGKAYFEKQLQDFNGNLPHAYAAYNAGPGATRKALERAKKEGGDWLSYLPKETQNYVAKNMKDFTSGGGKPKKPTLSEIQTLVREKIGTDNPEALTLALDEAERQFKTVELADKEQKEQATASAMQYIFDNQARFADLPPDVRASIPVEEVGKVMDFAKKISSREDISTDWGLYYQLKSDPALLNTTNLVTFRDRLSDGDFKELVKQQSEFRTGTGNTQSRVRTIKDTLDQYLVEMGVNPPQKNNYKKHAEVVGRIWNAFENKVRGRERDLGRALTPDELSQEAARLFANKVEVNGFFSNTPMPVAAIGEGDDIVIPPQEKAQIIKALTANGKLPTEDNIRNLYLRARGQ